MKYYVIVLAIFFTACAALGSKTKVYAGKRIKEIKTVGLITKRFDQPRNPYHKIIKESFNKGLIESLEAKALFKVVILDTMENEKLNVKSYIDTSNIDALLLAEWKLLNPHHLVSDANVQLTLLDKDTKEVILTSKHGTKLGNSYWSTPSLPKTLLDATEGALDTMEKTIKSK